MTEETDRRDRFRKSFWSSMSGAVSAVLRSRAHPALSGVFMLLTYEGRRTGRVYTLPVAYYLREGGEVWVLSGNGGWTRNMRGGHEADLLIRGREFRVSGTAVEDTKEVGDMMAELLRERGPRALRGHGLRLPTDRQPTHEEVMGAAEGVCMVRFRVLRETT
ncbi:nitroreductase/quinone reductase family protein [Nocardiopsis suaedae]|uniref:Nitroreductase/quinone reductase family protein n=1 Tax=Nocardiopsis suaedae TaxID=3018444 RepID=A0ABT4TTX0_9ACTN|nr:nitroreductase/quinone reductase family protein [Nocardiopsis suaedae]MDA2808154.1 nitroreductase/quinone reductase family protein [Nocardiopsis suaedae]